MKTENIDALHAAFNITKATATALLTQRGQSPAIVDEAADEILSHVTRYRPTVVDAGSEDTTAENLWALVAYLAKDTGAGESPMQRGMLLRHVNLMFAMSINNLTGGVLTEIRRKKGVKTSEIIFELVTEIENTRNDEAPGFLDFCGTVPKSLVLVCNMRQALIDFGLGASRVYMLIHYFHQNGFNYAHLTDATATQVAVLKDKAPPNTKFAGFSAWGKANFGSPDANWKGHFKKHVLDSDPKGDSERIDWKDELPVWWKELDIELTRAQARDKLTGPKFALVDAMFDGTDAPSDDDILPYGQVIAFIDALRDTKSIGTDLVEFLTTKYAPFYRDRSLFFGMNLSDAKVTRGDMTNNVFNVMGRRGNFFVVGKVENKQVTLSSCYLAKDMNERLNTGPTEIWPLR